MWFAPVLGRLNPGRSPTRGGPPRRYRPEVEALDGRLLPSFSPLGSFTVGDSPKALAVGDFNGDGKPDLATANPGSNTVSILLGLGAVGFSRAPDVPVGPGAFSVAGGDFNGDHHQDLAVTSEYSGSVNVLLGNGTGGFSRAPDVPAGTEPLSVAVGDFNRDGKQDLAVADIGSDTVSIRLGDGAGGFAVAPDVLVLGSKPSCVAVGDFNGDGIQDLVTTNFGSGDIGILLGYGSSGFFGHGHTYPVGTQPYFVAVGDFNRDGRQDLAVAVGGSEAIGILLGVGDGAGAFTAAPDVPVASGPPCVAVADFNGDGRQDLAIADVNGTSVGIRLGNGNGTFTPAPDVPVFGKTYPVFVAVADFNGDGKPDLATADEGSDAVGVLLNNGNTAVAVLDTFATPSLPQVVAVPFRKKGSARVRVLDASTGALRAVLTPFPGFGGRLLVQRLDVNGDGALDLIVRALVHGKRKQAAFDAVTLARLS